MNPRLLQMSLQADICIAPGRELTAREWEFCETARKHFFTVLFNREGKPYAFGARKNSTMLDGFDVRETRWPFDDESSMYTMRGA